MSPIRGAQRMHTMHQSQQHVIKIPTTTPAGHRPGYIFTCSDARGFTAVASSQQVPAPALAVHASLAAHLCAEHTLHLARRLPCRRCKPPVDSSTLLAGGLRGREAGWCAVTNRTNDKMTMPPLLHHSSKPPWTCLQNHAMGV
jgi:hypothetical protein